MQHSMRLNPGSDWAVIKWIGDLGYSSQPWQFKGGRWQRQQSIQSFLLHRLCLSVFVRQNQNCLGLPLSSLLLRGCFGRDSIWKEVWCLFLIPAIPSVRECQGLRRLWIRNIIQNEVLWEMWAEKSGNL